MAREVLHSDVPQLWVEQIPEPVPKEVERETDQRDRDTWKQRDPPQTAHVGAAVDDEGHAAGDYVSCDPLGQ